MVEQLDILDLVAEEVQDFEVGEGEFGQDGEVGVLDGDLLEVGVGFGEQRVDVVESAVAYVDVDEVG